MSKICVDSLPLSNNPFLVNDYSGVLIYSAIMDPLVKFDKRNRIIPNACKTFINKKDLFFEFVLRSDLYFQDGQKVSAKDYCEALNYILNNRCYAKFLFENIKNVSYINDKLQIELFNKDVFFLEKLTLMYVSPFKNRLTSGPYYIQKSTCKKITLKRNTYYRKKLKNINNDIIIFNVSKSTRKEIKDFVSGKIDMTNPTTFPLYKVNNYNVSINDSNLFFVLKFNKKYFDDKFDMWRKNIFGCIDKIKILEKVNYIYEIKDNFLLQKSSKKTDKHNNMQKKIFNNSIKMGYCEFYPNKIIALQIKKQLEKFGYVVKLHSCRLAEPNDNDINLEINYVGGNSNGIFYTSKYFKLVFGKEYRNVSQLYESSGNRKYLLKLCRMQSQQNKILPLLKLKNIYLKSDVLNNFELKKLNYYDL